jgi:hypothetical protein
VRPEDARIGAAPYRCAKAGSPRSRWGLSPAVTSSCPAGVDADPGSPPAWGPHRPAPEAGTSSWVSSACSCCQWRAKLRLVVLVAAVVLVSGPGPMAAQASTRALVLSSSSGARSSSGALYSTPYSCSAAATRAFIALRRATRSTRVISTWPLRVLGWWRRPRPGRLGRRSGRTCLAPVGRAVGPVGLDHLQTVGAHEPGQASLVGAGPSTPTRCTGPTRSAQVTSAT